MISESDHQLIAICRGAAQRSGEKHKYLELARIYSSRWFPHEWVILAMKDLLEVNSKRMYSLVEENKKLKEQSGLDK